MTLDPADRLAIHELLGLYGHLIDERRWSELDQVFTEDASYDATSFGQPVTTSLAALLEAWTGDMSVHPLAHHATNIVVTEDPDGTVRVLSKGIGVGRKGRVGTVTYRDVAVRTDDGWRLAARTAVLRRSEEW
jgi:3-phenylpropionate/cinnamic acid dioxygenase small subunit